MRRTRIALATTVLAAAALAASSASVFAYGRADQPLAQVEFSGNCNNPSFALCQQIGLGGIWLWIEIDSDHTADVAGANCHHLPGFGGSSQSIRVNGIPWSWSSTPQGLPGVLNPNLDPNGYYNLTFGPETLSFEVTQGHYSSHPAPGVAAEWTIAP